MSKPKLEHGTVAEMDSRRPKGIVIAWTPARAEEIRMKKFEARNKTLKTLGLAISMCVAVLVCGM
jgi:hypothetical protein